MRARRVPESAGPATPRVLQVQGRGLLLQGVPGAPQARARVPPRADTHAPRSPGRAFLCAQTLTRPLPSRPLRPAPSLPICRRQKAAWKAGHKRDCGGPGHGAAAAQIERAARRALTDDAGSDKAAVRRFDQAIDAARKLCADSKEVRDRVVEMGRVKMLLTGGGKDQEKDADAKLALAKDLQEQGAFDEALELCYQAVELYTQVSGHDCPSVGAVYNFIGAVYYSQGRYEETLVQYQKALEVLSKHCSYNNIASTYMNIANVYYSQGHYETALEYYHKSLDIKIRVVGHDSLDVAGTYNNMGMVYEKQGRYEEALDYHHRSLDIMIKVVGHDHLDVAKIYNNIAIVYRKQGRYEEALDYYHRDLEITVRVFGSEHLDVAVSYNNIAKIYGDQGRNEEALVEHQKALKVLLAVHGQEHPAVATSYQNMAVVYLELGDDSKGFEMFKKAYDINLKVLGPNHPSTQLLFRLFPTRLKP